MYLIFDFDGTLVDSVACAIDVFNALAIEFNFRKIAEDEKDNLKNLTAKQLMNLLQIPMYHVPAVLYQAKKHMRHEMQYLKPFSGIPQVLQELYEAGFNFGIVTSNSEKNVIAWLQNHDISQYFQFIKSAPNYFGKATTLNKIIKRKKLPRDKIYYIGDETRDIEAAKQCGIASVAVTWGFNSEKILSEYNPDYLVRQPEDILQLCGD